MTDDELPPSQTALIERFADHLSLERRLSGNTVAAYRRDLRQVAVFLDRQHLSLETATYPLLRRFLAQQTALGYARASIARRVGAIHTFYRWCLSRGVVEADPAALLGRPKVTNRLPTVHSSSTVAGIPSRSATSVPCSIETRRVCCRGGG